MEKHCEPHNDRKGDFKALRCNYLVDSALRMILLELILPTETNEDEVDKHNKSLRSQVGMLNIGEVQVLSVMYDQLSNSDLFADRFDSSRTIATLKDKISILKEILIDSSRTAKLWLQYMNCVSIIKKIVRAERSGN